MHSGLALKIKRKQANRGLNESSHALLPKRAA